MYAHVGQIQVSGSVGRINVRVEPQRWHAADRTVWAGPPRGSYESKRSKSRSKIERGRLTGDGSSPFHMWPHAPQNSIGCRRPIPSIRTVLLDRHAWQFGTG